MHVLLTGASGTVGQFLAPALLAAGHRVTVLDDRPENCLDVATDSEAKPILVWRDGTETVPPGATRLGMTARSMDGVPEVCRDHAS